MVTIAPCFVFAFTPFTSSIRTYVLKSTFLLFSTVCNWYPTWIVKDWKVESTELHIFLFIFSCKLFYSRFSPPIKIMIFYSLTFCPPIFATFITYCNSRHIYITFPHIDCSFNFFCFTWPELLSIPCCCVTFLDKRTLTLLTCQTEVTENDLMVGHIISG